MTGAFDKILDKCIDRINQGERLEDCLASYPEYANELEPLLRSVLDIQRAYTFTPSSKTKTTAKQYFSVALEERARRYEEGRLGYPRVLGWSKAWVAVAAVLLVALIGYFGLRPVLFPVEPDPAVVIPGPQPSPEGNFSFLISDDVNAINDFQSLDIYISKIGLQREGENDQWIEFDPEVEIVDLTLLQVYKAQEIWRGNVPEGRYTKVFIHVSDISGVLKGMGRVVSIKLPSEKLRISKQFEVTSGSMVSFVYDITVVEAGESGKYILKPQSGQSGVDQKFEEIE